MSQHPRHPAPAKKFSFISRDAAIRGASSALKKHGWPRFQMFMIVLITGLFGFVGSVVLFHLGVEQMAARYPLAIAIAYAVFLLQLWIWLHVEETWNGDIPVSFDGGSGHAYETADGTASVPDGVGDSLGSAAEVAADGEGCVVVLVLAVVVILAGGLVFTAFYLVWGAPVLMGELLVDAALSYGLYRNLRKQDREYWLFTALRRTAWVFLLVAMLALVCGAVLARMAPGSRTLGEAMDYRAALKEK